MEAEIIETTATRHCSFCAKASTEVAKVIAGAGVYICDECVALCNAILASPPPEPGTPRIPAPDVMSDEEILAFIPRIAVTGLQVERSLHEWVTVLRDRGVTWERIGAALGITRQSAWERFSAPA
ncbi:ClpX C4-type zinc finger protein [Bailinhaonella thermotolerans]|uniref:ClpX-type ZB domain-containing protein n=1 Tax=Bailinhaonella thermotolerans TaxID=1070861 RepID=A0A3A4A5H8_9ACTN|nr:hypothetical protein D5H75_30080 [Bailinhaonella thermotolerans]